MIFPAGASRLPEPSGRNTLWWPTPIGAAGRSWKGQVALVGRIDRGVSDRGALSPKGSVGKQELQQRRRFVQLRPVVTARIGALGTQILEQDDLRFAAEFTVAAGQL